MAAVLEMVQEVTAEVRAAATEVAAAAVARAVVKAAAVNAEMKEAAMRVARVAVETAAEVMVVVVATAEMTAVAAKGRQLRCRRRRWRRLWERQRRRRRAVAKARPSHLRRLLAFSPVAAGAARQSCQGGGDGGSIRPQKTRPASRPQGLCPAARCAAMRAPLEFPNGPKLGFCSPPFVNGRAERMASVKKVKRPNCKN